MGKKSSQGHGRPAGAYSQMTAEPKKSITPKPAEFQGGKGIPLNILRHLPHRHPQRKDQWDVHHEMRVPCPLTPKKKEKYSYRHIIKRHSMKVSKARQQASYVRWQISEENVNATGPKGCRSCISKV